MFQKTTLKNGLRIITVPQEGTKAATVFVLVGTGSKYEKKEISGASHFLEHLFFKGTKKRPSVFKIVEPLDKVGGIFNAFTGEEYTGYFVKVDSSHVNLALDWVSDIYLNSLFPEKEVEKERRVIIEEINMCLDAPMMYVGELWKRVLYGDQPAGWDISGNKETISKISRSQIMDYMKSQYAASNTVVCVSGNISSVKTVESVKKYFSKIRKTNSFLKEPVVEKQAWPKALVLEKNTDQTHLALGVRAYNLFHPQKYALEVLGTILGGMMSSRIFLEIRDKRGLSYYTHTNVDANPDTGYLMTSAGVDNSRVEEAITGILKEYKKISEKKVSAQELKRAKDHIKGKTALQLETSDAKASFYAGQELLEKKILTPEQIFASIDKVTANDILEVAKDIFKPQKLNLALIGPFKNKNKFQRLLRL